jgi:ribonuclease-3
MDRRKAAILELERRLGHVFEDRALLERALTHASVGRSAPDNEPLEFLGDRVLALAIAGELHARGPAEDAGALSKRLAALVRREACAEVGSVLGVGPALRLPGAETKRGARGQTRFLADACEAVIGALYLEIGFERARALVLAAWKPLIDRPHDERASNPKSRLQEWAAGGGRGAPRYRLVAREGPDHAPSFTVEVEVEGVGSARALAGSRRAAEKAAALSLLQRADLRA